MTDRKTVSKVHVLTSTALATPPPVGTHARAGVDVKGASVRTQLALAV